MQVLTSITSIATADQPRFIVPTSNTRKSGAKFPKLVARIFSSAALMALTLLVFASAFAPGHTFAAAATSQTVYTPTGPVTLQANEQRLLADINWTRYQAGLPQLALDSLITSVARDRSADMANRHYFSHYTPDGKTFFDGLKKWGVNYKLAGEIIAQNNYAAYQSADVSHQGFLNSPEHKQIIMMNNWTKVGIGQAVDGAGMFYYTVLFVQPRPTN